MLDDLIDLLPDPPQGSAAWTLCLGLMAFDVALFAIAVIPRLLR